MTTAFRALMVLLGLLAAPVARADLISIVNAGAPQDQNFFLPTGEDPRARPYHRAWNEDWVWHHDPLSDPFRAARLAVSIAEVDRHEGETDAIYVLSDDGWRLLGHLSEELDGGGTTTFALPDDLLDEAALGLEVRVDIAAGGTHQKVTLYSATLVGLAVAPGPPVAAPRVTASPVTLPPTVIPVPHSVVLLGTALAGLGLTRRRAARP